MKKRREEEGGKRKKTNLERDYCIIRIDKIKKKQQVSNLYIRKSLKIKQ